MTIEDKILVELARRHQGRNCYGWWRSWGSVPISIICLICGEIIAADKDEIEKHGIQHLKEKNLLPFL